MSNRLRRPHGPLGRLAELPPIVVNPPPPERPGRPERIHVHITVTLPPGFQPQPRRRAGAGLAFWVALAVLAWSMFG
jgi:hypothetical protein